MRSKSLVVATVFLFTLPGWCGHKLSPNEQRVLDSWLSLHPGYRAAIDADCNCPEDIQQMRTGYGGNWPADPDYHPYLVTGDFNSDGINDFAIAVVNQSKSAKNFTLLVFNGPFSSNPTGPAFVESALDLRYQGLAFGPPRPKPYRLVIGPFESDNTWILVPRNHSYKVEVNED